MVHGFLPGLRQENEFIQSKLFSTWDLKTVQTINNCVYVHINTYIEVDKQIHIYRHPQIHISIHMMLSLVLENKIELKLNGRATDETLKIYVFNI